MGVYVLHRNSYFPSGELIVATYNNLFFSYFSFTVRSYHLLLRQKLEDFVQLSIDRFYLLL